MDRDRHDRDTCCQTQKGSGSREPLRTGRESGAPRSPAKAALRPVGFVYLGAMVLTWAGNWPLMKLALGQVPPLVWVLFRLIGDAALGDPDRVVFVAGTARPGPANRGGDRLCRPCFLHEPGP